MAPALHSPNKKAGLSKSLWSWSDLSYCKAGFSASTAARSGAGGTCRGQTSGPNTLMPGLWASMASPPPPPPSTAPRSPTDQGPGQSPRGSVLLLLSAAVSLQTSVSADADVVTETTDE